MRHCMKLADFIGLWRVSRNIADHTGAGDTLFHGQAQIDGGGLYHETGKMTLPNGQVVAAERKYRWADTPTGIQVSFDDGRPFHVICPSDPSGVPTDQHWCPPDMYRVRYDFSDFPKWSAVWQVTGPRKDYTMISQYRPFAQTT